MHYNWVTMYVDGASDGNPGPSVVGAKAKDDEGNVIFAVGERLAGDKTANQAEYYALIFGVNTLMEYHTVDNLRILTDSAIVLNQILGKYRVLNAELKRLKEKAEETLSGTGAQIHLAKVSSKQNEAHKVCEKVKSGKTGGASGLVMVNLDEVKDYCKKNCHAGDVRQFDHEDCARKHCPLLGFTYRIFDLGNRE